ncbi:MAG: spermidine/putrescine ABC transporter substrate-binding protein [Betaproteobacteria bacterium HGW-Betaproteobacteria-7]|nr:MAG: spermidine/putrescine ABC transporter substrate-binding protein [Betaproteobacteria bacterium HGW-Betaproteobacteria-7]
MTCVRRCSFLLLLCCLAGLLPGPVAQAAEPGVLRVLAWPGYADPDVVRGFEQRHKVRVEVTLIDSDAALWQRMSASGGKDFDVFAVNTAELQRYIDGALAQPVDPAAIPNISRQLPRFRQVEAIPGLVRGGQVYGVPYTYAEMGLIYDRSQFVLPPDSIQALWDPGLRGRVLAYNGGVHNFSLAMLSLGSEQPFRIGAEQWRSTVERLIELRRNVLGFYAQPEDSVDLFRRHRVALMLANYGTQQLRLLRAAGADVGYVIPREGALAWLDCWVVASGARDRQLVEAWLNYMLEPEVSGLLVSRQSLGSTIAESAENRPQDHLRWLEAVEDVGRRERLWVRVISGDRLARVLAP